MTVSVFLMMLAAGLVCGAVSGALYPARKKAGLPFTVITDVITAFAAVGLHAAVMYFVCDGQFFVYAVLSEAAGFFMGHGAAKSVMRALSRLFACRERK